MKAAFTIFTLSWRRALNYRSVGLIYLLLSLLNISLTIIIWSIAYQNPDFRTQETYSTYISYFLLVVIFNQLVNSFTAGEISDEHIKRGGLSVFLLRPFPYLIYEMLLEIPWRILAFLMSVPAIILMTILFNKFIILRIDLVILTFLLVPAVYFLSFLIQIIIASLTFWLEDNQGILNLTEILFLLFSGVGIPIFFFPDSLRFISRFLPFEYILYFPVTLALGKIPLLQILISLFIIAVWILVLSLVSKLLWRKGLKKFTGEGI